LGMFGRLSVLVCIAAASPRILAIGTTETLFLDEATYNSPYGFGNLAASENFDRVFVNFNGVAAVDPRTGAVLWNTTIPVPPRIDGKTELYLYAFEFEDPVVVAEVIYQEDFDDAVYLVVMDQDTGVILWIWEDFGFGDVFPISRADASVNHLCTTQSSANTVMGRDARTGAVKFNVTFADAQQVYAFPNPNTASVLLRFVTGHATDVLRKFNALTNQVTVEYAIPASADVHVAANGEFYVWDDGAYFARIATGEVHHGTKHTVLLL
jgi:hypothetical protein